MQITLRQLEIFAAICQESTITGAARRLGLSQAATSQSLAELENQLQRRLFDRHGRRVVATRPPGSCCLRPPKSWTGFAIFRAALRFDPGSSASAPA